VSRETEDSTRLASFALLRRLGESERAAVARHLQRIEVEAEQMVFAEGDESHGLVFVAEGVLRVERGENALLGKAGKGECFGAFALASVGTREVSAVAEHASTVLVLSRGAFLRLADESPRTACRLLEAVLEEIATTARGGLSTLAAAAVDPVQAHP
jgi:CRP-like cAMP-binding protein